MLSSRQSLDINKDNVLWPIALSVINNVLCKQINRLDILNIPVVLQQQQNLTRNAPNLCALSELPYAHNDLYQPLLFSLAISKISICKAVLSLSLSQSLSVFPTVSIIAGHWSAQ